MATLNIKSNPLNTPWVLWYHSLDEPHWTKDTYTKVAEIFTVEEFIGVFNNFESFWIVPNYFKFFNFTFTKLTSNKIKSNVIY